MAVPSERSPTPVELDGVFDTRNAESRREAELVVEFVKGRNVPCPICGYNLRDSLTASCPECGSLVRLSLYGRVAKRPWAYTLAMWGLVCATVASVFAGGVGLAEPRISLIAASGLAGAASVVLLYLLETRFWTFWARYAQHRTAMVALCWVPLAIVIAASVLALVF